MASMAARQGPRRRRVHRTAAGKVMSGLKLAAAASTLGAASTAATTCSTSCSVLDNPAAKQSGSNENVLCPSGQ